MEQPLEALKNGAAAGLSVGMAVGLLNPMDTLKTRWQVYGGSYTFPQFLQQVLRGEGYWRGLHRPGVISNTLAMGLASSTRIGLYPYFREHAVRLSGSSEKQAGHMFVAGLLWRGQGSVGLK
eukprot:g5278.t1